MPNGSVEVGAQRAPAIGVRVRVVRDRLELGRHADELNALADAVGGPATTYFEAVDAWLAARPGLLPVSLLVDRGTELVGAAHLTLHRERAVWRLHKAGAGGEPFQLLATDPAAAGELTAAIHGELAALPGPWKLMLADLPAADRHLVAALTVGLGSTSVETAVDTPVLRFETGTGINGYLSRNVRAAVAKARNRITADGLELEVRWLWQHAPIVDGISEIVAVRRARNEQLGRGVDDPVEVATFRATMAGHARAGRARLAEVRIDGRLAAYAMCFHTGDGLWVYSNAVAPEFTRYSAGTIANAEVVRRAHADPGVRELNWGRGIQRYKVSGPVSISGTQTLTAWSSATTRRLLKLGRRLR